MYSDEIICIKTVIMKITNEVSFIEGKIYKAKMGYWIMAINEKGDEHCLGLRGDSFFNRHFKNITRH